MGCDVIMQVVYTINPWLELLQINKLLGKPQAHEQDILQFEAMAKAWVDRFCTIYQKAKVTPYIHAMHSHVGQFL